MYCNKSGSRGVATLILNLDIGWSTPRPGCFTQGKEPWYILHRKSGGSQDRFGRVWKKESLLTHRRSNSNRPARTAYTIRLNEASRCTPETVRSWWKVSPSQKTNSIYRLLRALSHLMQLINSVCVIKTKLVENCALLRYCVARSANSLPTFRDNQLVPQWPLKMGPIGCPETSVRYYPYTLRNNPEDYGSHLLSGGSLKSRNDFFSTLTKWRPGQSDNRDSSPGKCRTSLPHKIRICSGTQPAI